MTAQSQTQTELEVAILEAKIRDTGLESGRYATTAADITDGRQLLLRQWLIAQGAPENAVITASRHTLSYLWNMAPTSVSRFITENARKPRTVRRGIQPADLGNFLEDETSHGKSISDLLDEPVVPNAPPVDSTPTEAPATVPAPVSGLDIAAIARAAEAVIRPRLDAAKRDLEHTIDQKIATAARSEAERIGLGESAKAAVRDLASRAAHEATLKALESALPPREIEIIHSDGLRTNIGRQHQMFPTLLRLVGARGHNGHRLNIWITGPTGSGKTTAAEKVAEALAPTFTNYHHNADGKWELIVDGKILDLGLEHNGPFGADSSLDADYKLTGHKNAQGEFQWTTFLRIFAYGGVYVMDEIDNWMPSALVAANAPLANGWISTPHGMIQRHPDCCIIACANTWGTGATNDYVGRAKLDAATTNRFPNKIHWPIDEKLERAIAGDMGGLEWCAIVQKARQTAKERGLQVIFSPRNTFEGIAALQVGFSVAEVIEMNLTAGLKPEQITALGLDNLPLRAVA